MKLLKRAKKKAPTTYKVALNGNRDESIVSSGHERFPRGDAYCLVPIGESTLCYREYLVKFPRGVRIYLDPEVNKVVKPVGKTGRELLERFYDLKPKPIVFKWKRAKTLLDRARWIIPYSAHFLVIIEKSESGQSHTDDHEATLYFRKDDGDTIAVARQLYEGHIENCPKYPQPEIIRVELLEWRKLRQWFQDAITRDTYYEV